MEQLWIWFEEVEPKSWLVILFLASIGIVVLGEVWKRFPIGTRRFYPFAELVASSERIRSPKWIVFCSVSSGLLEVFEDSAFRTDWLIRIEISGIRAVSVLGEDELLQLRDASVLWVGESSFRSERLASRTAYVKLAFDVRGREAFLVFRVMTVRGDPAGRLVSYLRSLTPSC